MNDFTHTGQHLSEPLPWKESVFSQYPRPSDYPNYSTDLPSLADIKIMGYTIRTEHYRYVEWVAFNHTTYVADFDKVSKQLFHLGSFTC